VQRPQTARPRDAGISSRRSREREDAGGLHLNEDAHRLGNEGRVVPRWPRGGRRDRDRRGDGSGDRIGGGVGWYARDGVPVSRPETSLRSLIGKAKADRIAKAEEEAKGGER
jgi:hypothetical protein